MAFELNLLLEADIKNKKLKDAYSQLFASQCFKVPFLVWLLENPNSPLGLPGKITLYNHDCLHLLLGRNISNQDEAFVIGFTMGNDLKTRWFHVTIFKFFARFVYKFPYRFSPFDIKVFDLGFTYGRRVKVKQINHINFENYGNETIAALREHLDINMEELQVLENFESWLAKDFSA
ncbi:MAG: hypothetical protein KME64_32250 [Scytonematopsis contorta HA4267-MV1]|jgi:hypothetical protein|nr:hypothetical protein [Scytonematopsis contorta HA4267-MV1]